MAKFNGSNLMESVLDTQKSMVDQMVENTKKMANGNTLVNETINKGSEWYNHWLDSQKKTLGMTSEKAENMGNSFKENMDKAGDFFSNWQNNQTKAANNFWEMTQNWMQNNAAQAKGFDMSNPMAQYQNWVAQMSNAMNAMNAQNNWMNQFQNWSKGFMGQNPFSGENFKAQADNMTGLFNQFSEMMNYNWASMQKSLQAATPQEAFRNMMNVNDGFLRFAQMWSPMMSNIQNKTFNMDAFKKMTDPSVMKDMLDKMFGLMPEPSQQYFRNLSQLAQEQMKQFGTPATFYNQVKGMMGNAMPFTPNEMAENALGAYNNLRNSMNNVFAPMGKMMGNNEFTKNLSEWNDIADKMVAFNLKNAEMQHMIYQKGNEVMEQVAAWVMNKQENGEEINSLMSMYQEFLNISDAAFVSLFESDEYAQIMAETASLKMKLSKDIEHKMEQTLSNVPVATRSEMEEVYKTIYELKKQVRQLEKMLEMESIEESAPAKPSEQPAAKKGAPKK